MDVRFYAELEITLDYIRQTTHKQVIFVGLLLFLSCSWCSWTFLIMLTLCIFSFSELINSVTYKFSKVAVCFESVKTHTTNLAPTFQVCDIHNTNVKLESCTKWSEIQRHLNALQTFLSSLPFIKLSVSITATYSQESLKPRGFFNANKFDLSVARVPSW